MEAYNYINDMKYYDYLLEMAIDNEKINGIAKIGVAIKEDESFVRIGMIQEGILDKIKNAWESFKTFLKKLWAKFLDYFNRIILSDIEWLEKFKDIITKVKADDTEIDMTGNYANGIKNIVACNINPFSVYETGKDLSTTVDESANFVNAILGGNSTFKAGDDLVPFAKDWFLGGSEKRTIKMSELNMTDLYNYCHDWKKIESEIEKDQKAIVSSCDEIENKLNDYSKAVEKGTVDNTDNNAKEKPNESYVYNDGEIVYEAISKKERDSIPDNQFGLEKEHKYPMRNAKEVKSAIILFGKCDEKDKEHLAKNIMKFAKKYNVEIDKTSQVYKYSHSIKEVCIDNYYNNIIINEIGLGDVKEGVKKVKNSFLGKTEGTVNAPENNGKDDDKERVKIQNTNKSIAGNVSSVGDKDKTTNTKVITIDSKEKDSEKVDITKKKAATYKTVTQGILSAEMTAAQQIHSDYMKILRAHVSAHSSEDTNTAASTATDQSKNIELKEEDIKEIEKVIEILDAKGDKDPEYIKAKNDMITNFKKKYPQYQGDSQELINQVRNATKKGNNG